MATQARGLLAKRVLAMEKKKRNLWKARQPGVPASMLVYTQSGQEDSTVYEGMRPQALKDRMDCFERRKYNGPSNFRVGMGKCSSPNISLHFFFVAIVTRNNIEPREVRCFFVDATAYAPAPQTHKGPCSPLTVL